MSDSITSGGLRGVGMINSGGSGTKPGVATSLDRLIEVYEAVNAQAKDIKGKISGSEPANSECNPVTQEECIEGVVSRLQILAEDTLKTLSCVYKSLE